MGSPTPSLQKALLWSHQPHKLVFGELIDNHPFQSLELQKSEQWGILGLGVGFVLVVSPIPLSLK